MKSIPLDKFKKIFTFCIVIFIFAFLFFNFTYAVEGIVPCGTQTDPNTGAITNPCTYCHILKLGEKVINFIVSLVFPIAAVMIVVGGIFIMTAREKPDQVKKGREIVTAAVVGILITLLSWLILDTIFKIVSPNFEIASLGPWNQLRCGLPYGSSPGY